MPKPTLPENNMTQEHLTAQEPNWEEAHRRISHAIGGFSGDEARLLEKIFSDATFTPSEEHGSPTERKATQTSPGDRFNRTGGPRSKVATKARVLIVDGNRPTTTIMSDILQRHDLEVFAASDSQEGLKLAAKVRPHLVILDTMRPSIDGYRVAQSLRRMPQTAKTAILMLLARSDAGTDTLKTHEYAMHVRDLFKGLDYGLVGFLNKPVRDRDLVGRVKALLWARDFLE
jgi:CheY-like chemotaxis protein